MNKENLKPVKSSEEARTRGRQGGLASGRSRRKRKALREYLNTLLAMPSEADNGRNNAEEIAAALVNQALAGSIRAFETIRDTVGEKPTDRLDCTSSDRSMSPSPCPAIDFSGKSQEELLELTRVAFGLEQQQRQSQD